MQYHQIQDYKNSEKIIFIYIYCLFYYALRNKRRASSVGSMKVEISVGIIKKIAVNQYII